MSAIIALRHVNLANQSHIIMETPQLKDVDGAWNSGGIAVTGVADLQEWAQLLNRHLEDIIPLTEL